MVSNESIKEYVRKRYADHAIKAQQRTVGGSETSCCGSSKVEPKVTRCGYSDEEIDKLPVQAVSAAVGSGNPTAIADLKKGEVVLDLGSGGGIDVILAAREVGPTGKAIGVDMTDEMLELARKNLGESGMTNAEFRKGYFEDLPVDDESVDVIISNGAINLAPDKDKVFREAYRVLKPGGRLVVSDILTDEPLPEHIRNDPDKWASCVGGAIESDLYLEKLRYAGFEDVKLLSRRGDNVVFQADVQGFKPLSGIASIRNNAACSSARAEKV